MDTCEMLRLAEDSMTQLRMYFDRAKYTMQDVSDTYFQMNATPDNPRDWWKIVYEFKRNSVRAEIIEDALWHVEQAIQMLEETFKSMEKEMAA